MKLIDTRDAVGHVLCHDLTQIIRGVTKDARFRKGHVVQPEETLWDIAKNHGCACESVRKLNELKDDNLKAGSKLLLVKEITGKQN